jgi:hypothetical protein
MVLSPDAKEPLESIEEDHAYIIGGIVDSEIRKYLTMFYASRHGFQVCKPCSIHHMPGQVMKPALLTAEELPGQTGLHVYDHKMSEDLSEVTPCCV